MFTKRSLFLKKHARRVLIFKHALPVFAFLLASIIVAWPLLTPDKERFDLPIQKSNTKAPSMDMENVRFFAKDNKNQSLSIQASAVKEMDTAKQIAKLDNPVGDYTLTDGDILTGKTAYGWAYQQDKYFLFNQPITITSKSGYTTTTNNVKVTYDGIVDSEDAIHIVGPAGTLEAEGLHMQNKGNLIDFKGKTKSLIKLEQGKMTVITQNGLHINRLKKTITGEKNVHIIHEENILTADTVILYYTDNKENRIQKIVARGNVILDNGKNKITGSEGTYNPLSEEMEMNGNVYLYQGKSFTQGEKATLNMKTGDSHLLTSSKQDRIKGTLLPEDLKKQD